MVWRIYLLYFIFGGVRGWGWGRCFFFLFFLSFFSEVRGKLSVECRFLCGGGMYVCEGGMGGRGATGEGKMLPLQK